MKEILITPDETQREVLYDGYGIRLTELLSLKEKHKGETWILNTINKQLRASHRVSQELLLQGKVHTSSQQESDELLSALKSAAQHYQSEMQIGPEKEPLNTLRRTQERLTMNIKWQLKNK